MSLQFVDFNSDGQLDIVTTPWQGSAHWVPGSEKGWLAPKRIQDSQGQDIILSRYYDHGKGEYISAIAGSAEHLVSTYAVDWDQDGDLDLLLGAKNGQVYLRTNGGSQDKPAFASSNVSLTLADGSPFAIKGGLTAARPADWDGDGMLDLVCGSFDGGVTWYRNVGAKGSPKYASPLPLLAIPKVTDGSMGPTEDVYVTPVDYDGDGDLDLLVGGRFLKPAKRDSLSQDEQAELDGLYKRIGVVSDAVRGFKAKAREAVTDEDPVKVKEAVARAEESPENAKLLAEA